MTRKALLATVHIAKKELKLDDPTYRLVLERVTGYESAADCGDAQLEDVLKEFKRMGYRLRPMSKYRRPQGREEIEPQLKKIEALLAEAKRPWSYAQTLAKRICKVERLEWVPADELYKIITALEKDAARHGREYGG